jgi:hypothetical protein
MLDVGPHAGREFVEPLFQPVLDGRGSIIDE